MRMPSLLLALFLGALACETPKPAKPPATVLDPCDCDGRICGRLCDQVCGTCPDSGVCQADGRVCRPALPIGAPCAAALDCGIGRVCLGAQDGAPGGYCTKVCQEDSECPAPGRCEMGPRDERICVPSCEPESSPDSCRTEEGYRCNVDGFCPACAGSCLGRQCGDDGCGNPCDAFCTESGKVCDAGACSDAAYESLGALALKRWNVAALPDVNGDFLLVGGRRMAEFPGSVFSPVAVDTVERYRPGITAQITTLAPLPKALARPHAAVLDEVVYVAGGTLQPVAKNAPRTPSADVYRLFGGVWESMNSPVPHPAMGGALVAMGGKLYLVGGHTAGAEAMDVSDRLDVFEPELGRWSVAPSRPSARTLAAAVTDGHRLYLLGGWNGAKALATVEVFDPETGWSTADDLPVPVVGAQGIAVGGRLFLFGGTTGPGSDGLDGQTYGSPVTAVQVMDISTRRTTRLGHTYQEYLAQTPVLARDGRVLLFAPLSLDVNGAVARGDVVQFSVPAR